jgi:hypothetical protein
MQFNITPGEYYTRAGGFYVLTQSDQQVVAKISGRTPEERLANANAIAALPEVLAALVQYADHKNWTWNGRAWEWNGEGSAFYKGDPKQKTQYFPASKAVATECGSVAEAALKLARDGREAE